MRSELTFQKLPIVTFAPVVNDRILATVNSFVNPLDRQQRLLALGENQYQKHRNDHSARYSLSPALRKSAGDAAEQKHW
jgi:hypothetical protein